jgi:glycosyltransferase involved in cell wall biosynthesis
MDGPSPRDQRPPTAPSPRLRMLAADAMRVLYLCLDEGIPLLGRKGAAVHVREMVAALIRGGNEVAVVGPVLSKSAWEEPAGIAGRLTQILPEPEATATAAGLRAYNERIGLDNGLPGEVRRILYQSSVAGRLIHRFERQPPDLVYERLSLHGTAGPVVAEALGVPYVVEVNAPLAQEHSTYRGAWLGELATAGELWTLRRASAILAVSEELRDNIAARGVDRAMIHVVPNGVDGTRFSPGPKDEALRRSWGATDAPVLGFVGSLRPWHGVELLPDVLEGVRRRHEDVRLVVAGDGEMRTRLESDLLDRGLADATFFTGALPHDLVPPVIRSLDVALAPYPEPDHAFYFSPLKLFEYMACGTPVVAARIGQIADVVDDGRTGLLHEPGDIEAIVDACCTLIEDRELAERIGRHAARDGAGYTWDANAGRVMEIVDELSGDRDA